MDLLKELARADCDTEWVVEYCDQQPSVLTVKSVVDQSLPLHVLCRNAILLRKEAFLARIIEFYPGALLEPNQYGFLPIHKAVSIANDDHLPSIRTLVNACPASLSFKSLEGQTPVHLAISGPRSISTEVISFLVRENPQSVFIADKYGHLPLHKIAAKPRADENTILEIVRAGPSALKVPDHRG